jgi:uncharacterized protein (DUF433 family)
MTAVTYPHIEVAAEGVAMIAGTRTKVVEVVLDRLAHHWDADEIQRQHSYLSLAQIYAALAYYHDHQDEIDREIEERLEHVERIAADQPPSVVRAKLRLRGDST